ncbi:hypothetical protein [Pseudomonas costantinii]|uniref:hypothetical protein n=1 Tax=Pseudomonas costantinii TaxID=168469 RepID=UPI003F7563E9
MSLVGYAHLHQSLGLKAIAPTCVAMIKPVTRISMIGECLAVPHAVAPSADSVLDHILFALKHEGINLGILAQALEAVSEDQLPLLRPPSPRSALCSCTPSWTAMGACRAS